MATAGIIFAACGNNRGIPDGVYICNDDGTTFTFIFSGNTYKRSIDGEYLNERTFELVEEKNEAGISTGVMHIADHYGENEWKYELAGNKLTIDGMVYSKQNADPQQANNNSSTGGDGKIVFTFVNNYLKFEIDGNGEITIDWGDGVVETYEIGKDRERYLKSFDYYQGFSRSYPTKSERNVSITGKNIMRFRVSERGVTSLDVSKCAALKELHCSLNEIANLDVSKNKALEVLYCGGNKLSRLYVSKNSALKTLMCTTNILTGLDVSKNSALTELNCGVNRLSKLDVSKNTALVMLICQNNGLTSLDVSKNRALSLLECSSNEFKASALNAIFKALTNNNEGIIVISRNPGTDDCDRSIAIKKRWEVRDGSR